MSLFTTPANLELLENGKWKVITPFQYHVGDFPSWEVIVVPSGFITDLTSIPRVFWNILPPNGKYAKAAIIHDYMYVNAYKSKDYADKIFYDAMEVLGVPTWKKEVMYLAVKLFGKGNYK